MKNMKIKKRLITAFLIVVALGMVIGIIGIFGINSINNALNAMYEDNLTPLPSVADARESLQKVRLQLRVMIADADNANVDSDKVELNKAISTFESSMAIYKSHITNNNVDTLFSDSMKLWDNAVKPGILETTSLAEAGDQEAALTCVNEVAPHTNTIVENLIKMSDYEVSDAEVAYKKSDVTFYTLFGVIVGVIVIAVSVSIALALYIANLINNPLTRVVNIMSQVGKTGDLTLTSDQEAHLIEDMKGTDEIAECLVSFKSLYDHLQRTSDSLSLIAHGDLTGTVKTLSDKDVLGG